MDLVHLIKHPEQMDKETLYELRSLLALYPYYQTARILMLQNLFLLHDPTFDEELRRASIYITDRKILFQMIEAAHYRLRNLTKEKKPAEKTDHEPNRTVNLIDQFLETIPIEKPKEKRKPTPADAAVDYVAYLLETESEMEESAEEPVMKGQELIDNFINNDKGKIELKEIPEYLPEIDNETENDGKSEEEGYFTETLARIYIKQGKYSKALEIIKRLNLNYPKKSAYFADQIRFLEKLIINSQNK